MNSLYAEILKFLVHEAYYRWISNQQANTTHAVQQTREGPIHLGYALLQHMTHMYLFQVMTFPKNLRSQNKSVVKSQKGFISFWKRKREQKKNKETHPQSSNYCFITLIKNIRMPFLGIISDAYSDFKATTLYSIKAQQKYSQFLYYEEIQKKHYRLSRSHLPQQFINSLILTGATKLPTAASLLEDSVGVLRNEGQHVSITLSPKHEIQAIRNRT